MRHFINLAEALMPRMAKEFQYKVFVSKIRWDYLPEYEDSEGELLPRPKLPSSVSFILPMTAQEYLELKDESDIIEQEINEYLANHYEHYASYQYEIEPAHLSEALTPDAIHFIPTVKVKVSDIQWDFQGVEHDWELPHVPYETEIEIPVESKGDWIETGLREEIGSYLLDLYNVYPITFEYKVVS
jgi:hypothetical protein